MNAKYSYRVDLTLSEPLEDWQEKVMKHKISYYVLEMFNEDKNMKFNSIKVRKIEEDVKL